MRIRRLVIAASTVLLAVPLAAADTPAEPTPRQKANGEFLFENYPPRALAAREEGQVGFRVALATDGSLTSCEVTKSSGHASLDHETCELIVRHARFQPVRNSEGRTVAAIRDGFVNWKLPPDAPAVARRASSSASFDPEKIICRRQKRTGSWVATTKQCMTRQEWTRAGEAAREETEKMQRGADWCQIKGNC